MHHPITIHTLAKLHQIELMKDADAQRLLREASPSPTRRWLTILFLAAVGAAALSLLIG